MEDLKQGQSFHDVKFGLLGAFDVPKKNFDRWCVKSKDKIIWNNIYSAFEANDAFEKIFYEYKIVEKFFLDKQLFIGKRGDIDPSKPMRGVVSETFNVCIHLSKKCIRVSFKASLAYFEKQEVLQLLLFDMIPKIDIDSLIFLKQCKWYKSEKEGWRIVTNYSNEVEVTSISELCLSILSITGLDTKQINKEWPFFDFIEIENVSPDSKFIAKNLLSKSEYFALVTGDEGFRLVDPDADYVANVINNDKMKFVGRKYFLYHFSLTSCIAFFSKDRLQIRKEWSNYYKDNVGYIPSLYEYTHFTNTLPCIADGILLLVERCLLRYAELHRVYVNLTQPSFIRRVANKTFGKDRVYSILFRLDDLDIIIDNALWIIAHGYEDILFGYSNLRSSVEKAIERRSKNLFERLTLILAIIAAFIAMTSLFNTFTNNSGVKNQVQPKTYVQSAENQLITDKSLLPDESNTEIPVANFPQELKRPQDADTASSSSGIKGTEIRNNKIKPKADLGN